MIVQAGCTVEEWEKLRQKQAQLGMYTHQVSDFRITEDGECIHAASPSERLIFTAIDKKHFRFYNSRALIGVGSGNLKKVDWLTLEVKDRTGETVCYIHKSQNRLVFSKYKLK